METCYLAAVCRSLSRSLVMLIFAAEKSRLLWKLCQEMVELCYHLISTYFEDKEPHLYDHIYIYIVYKYIYVYFTQQKGHPKVAIYLQVSQCVWRQRWCLCGLNNHVKLCHVWLYNSCGWFKWDIQLYTTFNSHFSTTIKPCKNPCIEDVFTTIKHLNSTITQNIPHKTL